MGALPHDIIPNLYNAQLYHIGSKIYAVGVDSGGDDAIVLMSDDSGATWTEIDSAGAPSAGSSLNAIAAKLDGDIIHIASAHRSGTSVNLYYHQFDTSVGTDGEWDSTIVDEVIETSIDADMQDNSGINCELFIVGTNVYVFYNGASELISSTDYQRVDYAKRSDLTTSGTWSTGNAVDTGGTNHYRRFACTIDNDDVIHISLYDGADFAHVSLDTADDSKSSAQVFSSSDDFDFSTLIAHHEADNGDEKVILFYAKNPNDHIYSSLVTNDDTPATEVQVSTTDISNTEEEDQRSATGSDHLNKFFLIYVDVSENLRFTEWHNGTWSSVITLQSATVTEAAGATIFIDSDGNYQLAYLYEKGSLYYETHLLAVGLDHIAESSVLYAPTVENAAAALTVNLGFISDSNTVHDVTPVSTVNLGHIASTSTVHDVQSVTTVTLGHIASTSTVHAPTIGSELTINLGFIADETTLYDVSPKSEIELGHIASTTALHNVTVSSGLTVNLGHIASESTLYNLSPESEINLGHIASENVVHNITLLSTVDLAHIVSNSTLHAPTLESEIELGHIASETTLHAPTVGSELTINLGFIASENVVHDVTPISTIILGHIASDSVIYALTMGSGLSISLGYIASESTVHNVIPISTISLGHIAETTILYNLVASFDLTVNLGFIDDNNSVYDLSLRIGLIPDDNRGYSVPIRVRTYTPDARARTYIVRNDNR